MCCFFQLLHKSVDMMEKRLTGSSGILTLKCKDFQTLKLEIPTADDCLNIAASVESLSNIGHFILSHTVFSLVLVDCFCLMIIVISCHAAV